MYSRVQVLKQRLIIMADKQENNNSNAAKLWFFFQPTNHFPLLQNF